jgi:hypothetical protein
MFELCDAGTGCLWNLFFNSGQNIKLESPFIPADVNKTAGIVQKLVEPLLKLGCNTWMNNFHNLPIVVRTLNV